MSYPGAPRLPEKLSDRDLMIRYKMALEGIVALYRGCSPSVTELFKLAEKGLDVKEDE